MMFDFDTLADRGTMGSAKWARRTDAEKAENIVPMSIADMEFPCAPCVVEAVERAAHHGIYGYTDADGTYLDAVAGWMARRHGWAVERDWIVPENGVVPALCVAVRAYSKPGDSVLIQSPGYGPFRMAVEMNGRVPVFSPLKLGTDGRYHMDLGDLRKKAEETKAPLLFLCSPHNPVGRVWTKDELRELAHICAACGIFVVSDEIHADLVLYGTHTALPLAAPELAERCAVLTAPSKTFNVAGLQLANTIIPGGEARAAFRERASADGYSNVSYFGYHAVIAAYNEGEPWLDALIAYVRENFIFLNDWLKENLPAVRLLPVEGTYLAWMDWRALGMDDGALNRFVREEAMLFVNAGTMFGTGGEGFLRMNLALPRKELEKALHRLRTAAKNKKII